MPHSTRPQRSRMTLKPPTACMLLPGAGVFGFVSNNNPQSVSAHVSDVPGFPSQNSVILRTGGPTRTGLDRGHLHNPLPDMSGKKEDRIRQQWQWQCVQSLRIGLLVWPTFHKHLHEATWIDRTR